jgi:hypothetical protein
VHIKGKVHKKQLLKGTVKIQTFKEQEKNMNFLYMNASNPYLRVFESPIVFFFSSLCFPESKNGASLTNVDQK